MPSAQIIAFDQDHCIASGDIVDVAVQVKQILSSQPQSQILLFDLETSRPVEIDFRGSVADVTTRLRNSLAPEPAPRGPGRPKLGVVAREVTLLPRHWEWLAEQSGGASVTLRRLVDAARNAEADPARARKARETADRFMAAMLGNRPGYEEASRALYAGDRGRFMELSEPWPVDLRDHARRLAAPGFSS